MPRQKSSYILSNDSESFFSRFPFCRRGCLQVVPVLNAPVIRAVDLQFVDVRPYGAKILRRHGPRFLQPNPEKRLMQSHQEACIKTRRVDIDACLDSGIKLARATSGHEAR